MRILLKFYFIAILTLISCSEENEGVELPEENIESSSKISAADISSFPEISNSEIKFYDRTGTRSDFLDILKNSGINTIRLRIWVDPINDYSGFQEVLDFSKLLKAKGFKIWITIHYSDTWADPGQQELPSQWKEANYSELKQLVQDYTALVTSEIQPDYIQIGNEINSGLLFPHGDINSYPEQFLELISIASKSIRSHSSKTKIILHFAGIDGSSWFFNKVKNIDYDIIGLSYYPIWHGKNLNNLSAKLNELNVAYDKKILIAETAYPFTLDWNDLTNNIVGLESQLILPDFPATPEGQQLFIREINTITNEIDGVIGFCYWGGELVAWKGQESEEGSSWENQALFDFQNKALPVLEEFKVE